MHSESSDWWHLRKQKVYRALLEWRSGENSPRDVFAHIADLSEVPRGHVEQIVRAIPGASPTLGGGLGLTREGWDYVEAQVKDPAPPAHATGNGGSVNYDLRGATLLASNLGGGTIELSADIRISEIIHLLLERIDQAELPPDEKEKTRSELRAFLGAPITANTLNFLSMTMQALGLVNSL